MFTQVYWFITECESVFFVCLCNDLSLPFAVFLIPAALSALRELKESDESTETQTRGTKLLRVCSEPFFIFVFTFYRQQTKSLICRKRNCSFWPQARLPSYIISYKYQYTSTEAIYYKIKLIYTSEIKYSRLSSFNSLNVDSLFAYNVFFSLSQTLHFSQCEDHLAAWSKEMSIIMQVVVCDKTEKREQKHLK